MEGCLKADVATGLLHPKKETHKKEQSPLSHVIQYPTWPGPSDLQHVSHFRHFSNARIETIKASPGKPGESPQLEGI